MAICTINTILLVVVAHVNTTPNVPIIIMFSVMILAFGVLYKSTFMENVFCALACIIHVLILRTIVIGAFSMATGYWVNKIFSVTYLNLITDVILFAFLDIAIVLVLKMIPIDKVRIVNQHKESQWFLITWMLANNVYLLYNSDVFYRSQEQPYLIGSQVALPLTIMVGLYIVTFFAIRVVSLLGYKEKGEQLTQTMLQEQQYRSSVTKDAIFTYEFNVTKGIILRGFENQRQELGNMVDNYADMLTFSANQIIHSEDIESFVNYASQDNLLRKFESGNSEVTWEYRRLTESGEYIWVRSIINLLRDMKTEDVIAYACIKDIDKEKKHQLELQYMAEHDPLTGLYNKEITKKLVNEYLNSVHKPCLSALFMIDVDNFKAVNDNLGHIYGDVVLCEIGEKLHKIFGSDNIIGRIGGDEFIVFMKKYSSIKMIQDKAQEILNSILVTYSGMQENKYTISSSIGISIFPKDGQCFNELYTNADSALYSAKSDGKNRYKIYDGSDFGGYDSDRVDSQLNTAIGSKNFRENRIEYVFKILYQSENAVEAIHSVLELISNHFSFERGYIFETDKGGKTTSNTFEWCANGVTPQREKLQNLPIDVIAEANASFYKTGTYIVKTLSDLNPIEHAILKPQCIRSIFQFGIFDKCKLLGFIGFDNCSSEIQPSGEEIDEMSTICNILATFLVKQHNDELAMQELQVRQAVMNHLSNIVYVINPQTFEVLFMNDQTRKRVGDVENNKPCYLFFRGNTEQCVDCPLRMLDGDSSAQVCHEIYNNKFNIWLETTASILRWTDGSLACLLECANITQQKEEHLHHIAQLEKLAYVDELTGIRTFCKFKIDAQRILEKQQDIDHILVKLDIDNFKLVNQIYGYEKGNEILCCVALALEKTVRNQNEITARISDDEFIALLVMENFATVKKLNDNFIHHFNTLMDSDVGFKCIFLHGIYVIKANNIQSFDINNLFEKVNIAHKEAKRNKDKEYIVYDESMTQKAMRVKEIENKMKDALIHNEFVVYLQPKYYLNTEMIGGAEALVRWENKNTDYFFPDAFIPIFERNGFILKLDFYVLCKVCHIIKAWLLEGIAPVAVSVNFSRLHLNNPNFVKELCKIVDKIGIDRKYIEVEITETAIYDNLNTLNVVLAELHKNGFLMSMDDFGSGYSSLGMLKDLSVDAIKMDRSFFANQRDVERSKIVVGNIIRMAKELGICIVAEGVEEQQHIDLLQELHCNMVQGYYYARPMPLENFTKLIKYPKRFNETR
ncbi:MAG: EAL domain-containing protein [Lachnospiraceae bacterium]